MLPQKKSSSLMDLVSIFEDYVTPEDVVATKAMSEVSKSIIRERLRLKMTQKEFADYINVKQSQISRWEKGDYNFSLQKLAEIAAKLDLDLSVKLTRKPKYNFNLRFVSDSDNDLKKLETPKSFYGQQTPYTFRKNSIERRKTYVSI